MAHITLQVLDGADRGRIFGELPTPVTIGREEGNTIQLNDERVSRFHLKIQEDQEKVVLTDLESTNGTKVNGEEIQLRILRYGDVIAVGRSVLLFGSREQIAERLARLRGAEPVSAGTIGPEDAAGSGDAASLDFELQWAEDANAQRTLHTLLPPELPERLSPGQAAQLAEILEYLHIRVRHLIGTVKPEGQSDRVNLDARKWQGLLDLQGRLASYLRHVGEPGDEG
jgi:pSer/pThr/pTyr-binding forkhead associated (FHA) protein